MSSGPADMDAGATTHGGLPDADGGGKASPLDAGAEAPDAEPPDGGDNDSGAPRPPAPPATIAAFCEGIVARAQQVQEDCAYHPSWCSEPWESARNPLPTGMGGAYCPHSPDSLEHLRRDCAALASDEASGHITFDRARAGQCLAELGSSCGDAMVGLDKPQRWPAPCRRVVAGALDFGEPCYPGSNLFGDGCADGYCARTTCPGVCQPYPGLGEECNGNSADGWWVDPCDPREYGCSGLGDGCQPFGTTDQPCPCARGFECVNGDWCQPVGRKGETCSEDDDCAHPLLCVNGTCAAYHQPGEACTGRCAPGYRCDGTCVRMGAGLSCEGSYHCPPGYDCDASNTCTALPAAGESCAELPCGEGLVCWDDALGDVCRPPAQLGESCLGQAGPASFRCTAGLFCVVTEWSADTPTAMHCQARGMAAGDLCNPRERWSCKPPFYCDAAGTCVPQLQQGQPCETTGQCVLGTACVFEPEVTGEWGDVCHETSQISCDGSGDCAAGEECRESSCGSPTILYDRYTCPVGTL